MSQCKDMTVDQTKDLPAASEMKPLQHLRRGICWLNMALAVAPLAFHGSSVATESASLAKVTELESSASPNGPGADAIQGAPDDAATSPRRATRAERRVIQRYRARSQQSQLATLRANQDQTATAMSAGPAMVLTDIMVVMKLDPRASGLAGGEERWVTPPTYSGASAQSIVVARAFGINARGVPVSIRPEWIPADPEMVTVSTAPGNAVQIAVHRAGESKLTVLAAGVSRDLSISATYEGQVIHVQVSQ